jgi:hypothetical protein
LLVRSSRERDRQRWRSGSPALAIGAPPLARARLALVTGALVALAAAEGCARSGPAPASDAAAGETPSAEAAASSTAATTATAEDAATAESKDGGGDDSGIMNVTAVPTAAVAALVNPFRLPPYSGPTGSVEGTITVTGDMAPATPGDFSRCPGAERAWGRAFREGTPTKGIRPLADAVVVVTGYSNFFMPEKQEAKEVVIEDCAYTTRTATMTFGQRLDVRNLSKDFWTPVLEPGSNMVLMMATPKGDPAKIYPKEAGHYLLMDRDRKYVNVDVYTFLHPLHGSSDLTGHYRIDGLPVGKLKVSSTHPRIEANAKADLTVMAGVVHKVDLVLKNVNRDAGARSDAGSVSAPLLH